MLDPRLISDPAEWQSLLAQFPDPHPLQSYAWGEIKSRWAWQMRPTAIFDGDQAVACALILKRPLPRTPFSILYLPKGPVFDFDQSDYRAAVWEALEETGRREGALLVKVDPQIASAYGDEAEDAPFGREIEAELSGRGWRFSPEQIQFKNTVTLDLTRPEEDILASFKQKTRYNIRLAGRKGIEIVRGEASDFEMILTMYRETAERDNFILRPDAYYLDAWQTFWDAGMCQPFIATYEGTPIAAVIIIHGGQTAIYMYGASTHLERNRMPTYLLQWEAIRWAQENGYQSYDFWGAPTIFEESDPLWGVWRFKKGFNGIVVHSIGAWDYPVRPLAYRLFTEALPRYRNFLRRRLRSGASQPTD